MRSDVKSWSGGQRQQSLLLLLALAVTLTVALAITNLIFSERIDGRSAAGENTISDNLIRKTFPTYKSYSERIINGINLQTVSGNSGALGYSAVLFDVGCSSCPNEKLFVAASAKERRIIAVELLAADQDEHGDLNEFLKQFVGKKPGDELSLGRGIELKSELINLNGAIAIADRINEFLRALSELEK